MLQKSMGKIHRLTVKRTSEVLTSVLVYKGTSSLHHSIIAYICIVHLYKPPCEIVVNSREDQQSLESCEIKGLKM